MTAASSLMLQRIAPLLFVGLWSSAFIAIRGGLPDVSPLFFLSARFMLAAVALLAVAAILRTDWASLRKGWAHLVVVGILMNAIYLSGAYLALEHLQAATMALIGALHPVITALLAGPILGERLRPIQWLGLALGIAGVVIVVGIEAAELSDLIGALLGGGGVTALALGTVYYRRFCRQIPLRAANTVQLGSAAIACTLLTAGFEQVHASWTPALVGTLLYLALIVSLGAMVLLMFMLRTGNAGKVASNFYLTPGLTAILGWLVLDETFEIAAVAGLLVASLGVWLAHHERPARVTR